MKGAKKARRSDRITEYSDREIIDRLDPGVELPRQERFYKIAKRFGHIPVDENPLGCDPDKQYKIHYPRVDLPLQQADRVSFGFPKLKPNRLFWGDNIHIMRQLPSRSIDLIYLDPPFFSGMDYNVIFGDQNEIRSFSDIWEGGMPSYLIWLNARLLEMKRLLKPDGSIYVHLDWHASHYVKVEMDKMFGYENFRREVVWDIGVLSGFKTATANWIRGHDILLYYVMDGKKYTFNRQRQPHRQEYLDRFDKVDENGRRYFDGRGKRRYLDEVVKKGKAVGDVWADIMSFQQTPTAREKIGYPTQKPSELLERIIRASSNEGDVVADFFCGGGTTPFAAERLGRRWIACDQSRVAVAITQGRLERLHEKAGDSSAQQALAPVPDMVVEYWGTYAVSGLERMPEAEFRDFVVQAYGGRRSTGEIVHGYKKRIPLSVGPARQSARVTKGEVLQFSQEVARLGLPGGTMLGWSFARSARLATEKLRSARDADITLIQISLVKIDSDEFRGHVTRLHSKYGSLLAFIIPPEVTVNCSPKDAMTYAFDASESIALNAGARIINVQWDFDYSGRFVPTQKFAYGTKGSAANMEPMFRAEYRFKHRGKTTIACRVQDDLGGERIQAMEVYIK